MNEDRTIPMRQQQWPQKEDGLDDQETVHADQEGKTPPTIPLGDEAGRVQKAGPGSEHPVPRESTTPQPFQLRQPPLGQPYQDLGAPGDQTMLISELPTPVFAWLVMVDGPERGGIGRVHSLRADTTTIGRVRGNHIVLQDETCSAQHAVIRIEAKEDQDSAFVLYDMGSSNGTFVGDRESYKDEENRKYRHELQDGDYLLVGETTLAFKKL